MQGLKIDGLCKGFGDLLILQDVCFDVAVGRRHAVIGPNGAGKSTLFNLISGRFAPTHGSIIWNGTELSGRPPHVIVREGVARSFQIINVFPNLTVLENIRGAVATRQGNPWSVCETAGHARELTDRAEGILETVGLAHARNALAKNMSYGDQRRLEIGLTVALEPQLILLDEPCAGLNAEDTHAAVSLIRKISEGRTLLVVEHDMDVVFGLADAITVLHHGSVLLTGSPQEIRSHEIVREAYLGNKLDADA